MDFVQLPGWVGESRRPRRLGQAPQGQATQSGCAATKFCTVSVVTSRSSVIESALSAWRSSGAGPVYGTYWPLFVLIVTIELGLMPLSVKIQSETLRGWPGLSWPGSKVNALPSEVRKSEICVGLLIPLSYASCSSALMNCCW